MFQATHYTVSSSRIPNAFDKFKIAHLSDLHGMLHGNENSDLINTIKELNPDIVIMTGDMADESKHAVSRAKALCQKLSRHFPIYYVLGNHEQTLSKTVLSNLIHDLKSFGIMVLENEFCELQKQNTVIRLYGLTMPMVYYKDPFGEYKRGAHFSKTDTTEALGTLDPAYYNILLAHNPLYFPSYRDWGTDLTLSGHVHGGIIDLPYFGSLLSPELRLFPKYARGHIVEDQKHLIVSRGLGNNFLFRVNNPAELVLVQLKHQ